ncbi:MAG: hypothetical protein ACOCRB_02240 [Halanaerobiaceae bacterium]
MSNTKISISGKKFLINGEETYSNIEGINPEVKGLLMNARFIQGIFDDQADPDRFARFGNNEYDPEENTDNLIKALPQWYEHGLRAFTVGFQGGGPCFTVDNSTIENNPFGEDGKTIDPAYKGRMKRLIEAADELGMVVIVSFFYPGQVHRLQDEKAVKNAVISASRFLKEGGYTNVLIEIANEHDIASPHDIITEPEGMVELIKLAREESGGIPVGSSRTGGSADEKVAKASDYVLIHGNGCSRQDYYKLVRKVKNWCPDKPVVCNEDSQKIDQLEVAYNTYSSWGYYNNMTKQEPPADWGITEGDDRFFAWRMAMGLGIEVPAIPREEQFYLQGFEEKMTYEGKRWPRLSCLYPETVDHVDFYLDGKLIYTAYDSPFTLYHRSTWYQEGIEFKPENEEFKAVIHLSNGGTLERAVKL